MVIGLYICIYTLRWRWTAMEDKKLHLRQNSQDWLTPRIQWATNTAHRRRVTDWLRSESKSGQGRLHTHSVVCSLFYNAVSISGSKTSSSSGVSFLDNSALRKSSMDKFNTLWVKWDMRMTPRKVPTLILRQWTFFHAQMNDPTYKLLCMK
jgi:hypothetical protein